MTLTSTFRHQESLFQEKMLNLVMNNGEKQIIKERGEQKQRLTKNLALLSILVEL